MHTGKDALALDSLLRSSLELDVVGDVTATVAHPSDLLAWSVALEDPEVCGWRTADSGHRYVQVAAARDRPPARGFVSAVLDCEHHRWFWEALGLGDLAPGARRALSVRALGEAALPVTLEGVVEDGPDGSPEEG